MGVGVGGGGGGGGCGGGGDFGQEGLKCFGRSEVLDEQSMSDA